MALHEEWLAMIGAVAAGGLVTMKGRGYLGGAGARTVTCQLPGARIGPLA